MARRLTLLDDEEFAAVCARLDAGGTDRGDLRAATKHTLALLQAKAPGSSVEVRVPPFVAVQCISGPKHRRGNPPNVVETDPRTWLLLATGLLDVADAAASGALRLSGARAGEIAGLLPLVSVNGWSLWM